MKVKNVSFVPSYWEEGQKKEYHWYKKGFWKRHFRKRWVRQIIWGAQKDQ